MKKPILFIACILLAANFTFAQPLSPDFFLGHQVGEKFTPHFRLVQYFEALAKSAPTQTRLEQYGKTNEGRPLLLMVLSGAENLSNLENIRQQNLKSIGLDGGGGNNTGKAIVWLSYNVHGNEASSSEAAMMTAYYLLTDPKGQEWLKNTVVIIDPCLNPDGRDRYVNWFNSVVGKNMDPDPMAREHMEPWPGGRSNHYLFDLNRDWAWQTQVETRQRINAYNKWMPHVHVDFHEQGYNSPYYFAPAAEPFHEVITPWQREFQTRIGRNHARHFDEQGWLYFTKERFDLLYPSYGDTWPTYNGAIGMTYEQAGHSRAGLGIITNDGDTLTLRDRALHHHTTGISTVEIASQNAAALASNFVDFFKKTKASGVGDYRTFVVKTGNSLSKVNRLIELLDKNGIEYSVGRTGSARGFNYATAKEESFNFGRNDLFINTDQVRGTMVKVLFEPNSKVVDSATYDITAWSLPYAYGLQAFGLKEKLTGNSPGFELPQPSSISPDAYGFVVKWNSFNTARFLAQALKAGIKARVAEKPFKVGKQDYPAGSLIFIRTSNQGIQTFGQRVLDLAKKEGVEIAAVTTGFMDQGADFGSPDVRTIHPLRIAMASGEGTSSLGLGELWHFFENELDYPVTQILLRDLSRADLRRYDVLILPDGFNYSDLLKKEGALRSWVNQGGKLIALENAVSQLARAEWGLNEKDAEEAKKVDSLLLRRYENRERDALRDFNPGSIYRVTVDESHPLGFGIGNPYYTLKGDTKVYAYTSSGWNAGVIRKNAHVAGFVGSNAQSKLENGLIFGELPQGRGSVIFIADDPVFRSFWENGKLLLSNAIFMTNTGSSFTL